MNKPVRLSPTRSAKAASAPAGAARSASPPKRTKDPERTAADILEVATQEFSEKGLAGARIDDIAAATRTSKRMIYYYFGSKEGLYVAVLEEAYRRMREIESGLKLSDLSPEAALRDVLARYPAAKSGCARRSAHRLRRRGRALGLR